MNGMTNDQIMEIINIAHGNDTLRDMLNSFHMENRQLRVQVDQLRVQVVQSDEALQNVREASDEALRNVREASDEIMQNVREASEEKLELKRQLREASGEKKQVEDWTKVLETLNMRLFCIIMVYCMYNVGILQRFSLFM
jgi:GTP1/Obg family GTP-binding protein